MVAIPNLYEKLRNLQDIYNYKGYEGLEGYKGAKAWIESREDNEKQVFLPVLEYIEREGIGRVDLHSEAIDKIYRALEKFDREKIRAELFEWANPDWGVKELIDAAHDYQENCAFGLYLKAFLLNYLKTGSQGWMRLRFSTLGKSCLDEIINHTIPQEVF